MLIEDKDIPVVPLPTLDRLGATIPADLQDKEVVKQWFQSFAKAMEAGDAKGVESLLLPGAFWRDMLALTWDFRTFHGLPTITQFLTDRLGSVHPRNFKLRDDQYLGLQKPFPDLAWINFMFDFETDAGIASGIGRLVLTANNEWKLHNIFTNLEDLKGFPEKKGALRNPASNHGKWEEQRQREREFKDTPPTVLIVGGGQSGLELAARLKAQGILSLVVEKNLRIGDNWRNRYDALCLHDPVWYDHMPYLSFPTTWPVYCPARKLAKWLENYAESLELNVWTDTTVVNAKPDAGGKWSVTVKRGDGNETTLLVNHLVFATGLGSGAEKVPSYPGMDKFKGQILHSTRHKRATDHLGKKVVVVGACTSGHDIAEDYYEHGIDVTMYQRGSTYVMSTKNGFKVALEALYSEQGPPTDIADRLNASFPHFMSVEFNQRLVKAIAELDKDTLQGLEKRGFKLNYGIHDTGFGLLAWHHAGGYYLDTGASQLIVDGKIKLKSGTLIQTFTENGIKFEDGSELEADVVVFATGLGDAKESARKVLGDELANKCHPVWGLDKEGEISGIYRYTGLQNLWFILGNLALCRFHSKHLALQIKAIEEGVMGERYSPVA